MNVESLDGTARHLHLASRIGSCKGTFGWRRRASKNRVWGHRSQLQRPSLPHRLIPRTKRTGENGKMVVGRAWSLSVERMLPKAVMQVESLGVANEMQDQAGKDSLGKGSSM